MTLGIILGRVGSSRFKEKLIRKIDGKTIFELFLDNLIKCKNINKLVFATTSDPKNKILIDIAKKNIDHVIGSEKNVLNRIIKSINLYGENSEFIVRANSDNPLINPILIDKEINFLKNKTKEMFTPFDHNHNLFGSSLTIFRKKSLYNLYKICKNPRYLEHIDNYFLEKKRNKVLFSQEKKINNFDKSLTLDYENDYKKIALIYPLSKKNIDINNFFNSLKINLIGFNQNHNLDILNILNSFKIFFQK